MKSNLSSLNFATYKIIVCICLSVFLIIAIFFLSFESSSEVEIFDPASAIASKRSDNIPLGNYRIASSDAPNRGIAVPAQFLSAGPRHGSRWFNIYSRISSPRYRRHSLKTITQLFIISVSQTSPPNLSTVSPCTKGLGQNFPWRTPPPPFPRPFFSPWQHPGT